MISYVRGRLSGRRLSDSQIVDAYAAGEPAYDVGLRAGCDGTTVLRLVRAAGVPIRPGGRGARKALPLADAEVCRLYREGLSGPALADRCGTSTATIYHILRRGGVVTRPPLNHRTKRSFTQGSANKARRHGED